MEREHANAFAGSTLLDSRGVRVGRIADVVVDDRTLEPRWAVVTFGLLHRRTLVPTDHLYTTDAGAVAATVDRDLIRHGPRIQGEPREVIGQAERYYAGT